MVLNNQSILVINDLKISFYVFQEYAWTTLKSLADLPHKEIRWIAGSNRHYTDQWIKLARKGLMD
jgi:hypothetical protein